MNVLYVPDDIAEGEEAAVDGDSLLGPVTSSTSPETSGIVTKISVVYQNAMCIWIRTLKFSSI